MPTHHTFHVSSIAPGSQRADRFLSAIFPDHSRTYISRCIDAGHLKRGDATLAKDDRIGYRDEIVFSFLYEQIGVHPEDMPLHIVFENADFAVINKDPGVNIHPVPGEGGNEHTIVNALLYHLKNLGTINGVERPGIVHRLDKDTSGLVIIAKHDQSMQTLATLIADRKVKKTYLALVDGIPEMSGEIISWIGRDPHHRTRMTTRNPLHPKEARTLFRVIGTLQKKYALCEVDLITGRTHQIRVHMADIGFPIVADQVYGNISTNQWFAKKYHLHRQCLHAWKLAFCLQKTDYCFTGSLKSDMEFLLREVDFFDDADYRRVGEMVFGSRK